MKWWLLIFWNIVRKPGKGKRVFVGVSGGVDSSVSALLLKLYGYQVAGIFIRTWQPDWIACTWRDERRDAMRVCAHLEIPFQELDLEQEYEQGVANYMITEYQKGRTPNPDVMCNREVKFGGFLKYVRAQEIDFVATGHYAQTDHEHLYKGGDEAKEQSYFLWTLTRDQLQHILFPIGHLQKKQVRTLARWYRIPTATKKDSQGICFIGDINMKDFLSHYIHTEPGNVIDQDGEIIGSHQGVLFYTLGERHGFTIHKKTTSEQPYYIVDKNITDNTLTVSHDVHHIISSEIIITDGVWRTNIDEDKKYTAQVRYHGILHECLLKKRGDNFQVIFTDPEPVSPGQSIVVYDGDTCIGGGIVL
jgi:tRNA-specific 2-thiouridylase